MRLCFVLCSCCVVVGFIAFGSTPALFGWNDQSFTAFKLETRLETPVELKFDDVPLRAAVEKLCERAHIEVSWDEAALAEVELPADETVALSLPKQISLRSALNLVLEPCYLAYEVQGERQLQITSRQRWSERTVSVRYDVHDLVTTNGSEAELTSLIQNTIQPEHWQVDSPSFAGYLHLAQGELQVTQYRHVQQEIVSLLAELRAKQAPQ